MRVELEKLVSICENHVLESDLNAVLREPYVPYLPDGWDSGILVLAESQHLVGKNHDYACRLKAMRKRSRILRLYEDGGNGVGPWDDGILKLAVEAALGARPGTCAVGNAVPWTVSTGKTSNENPTKLLRSKAISYWVEMLAEIKPGLLVLAGRVAQSVLRSAIDKAGIDVRLVHWWLPSPRSITRVSGTFSTDDLLYRYPEVKKIIQNNPEYWDSMDLKRDIVFYACHAVNLSKGQGTSL